MKQIFKNKETNASLVCSFLFIISFFFSLIWGIENGLETGFRWFIGGACCLGVFLSWMLFKALKDKKVISSKVDMLLLENHNLKMSLKDNEFQTLTVADLVEGLHKFAEFFYSVPLYNGEMDSKNSFTFEDCEIVWDICMKIHAKTYALMAIPEEGTVKVNGVLVQNTYKDEKVREYARKLLSMELEKLFNVSELDLMMKTRQKSNEKIRREEEENGYAV